MKSKIFSPETVLALGYDQLRKAISSAEDETLQLARSCTQKETLDMVGLKERQIPILWLIWGD